MELKNKTDKIIQIEKKQGQFDKNQGNKVDNP